MEPHDIQLSKRMSRVLRHAPESVGIELDAHGWVDLTTLVHALNRSGRRVTDNDVIRVVESNDKKRYAIEGGRIRASQGHSIDIDLALDPSTPPDTLWHGTVGRFLASILTEGLRPGERRHVHLSADPEVARSVGQRRGKPVILTIAAGAMSSAGHTFWCSANGVWLTDHVPAEYLSAAD